MADVVNAQDSVVNQIPSTPTPISAASIPNNDIGGGSTPYVVPRQTGSGNARGVQNITGYILVTDPATNVSQVIIGTLPDGTYGIVISKPGIDVITVFS